MRKFRLFLAACFANLVVSASLGQEPQSQDSFTCPIPDVDPLEDHITLLSMNIQNLSIKNGNYDPNRYNCLSDIAGQFNVVAFQENFEKRSPQIDNSFYVTPRTGSNMYTYNSSGLNMYSTYPLHNISFTAFNQCSGGLFGGAGDCLANKGVLSSVININGHNIPFITTHLDAGKHRNDQIARLSQLQELSALVPRDGQVIVTGDFNLKRGTEDSVLENFLHTNNLTLVMRHDDIKGNDLIAVRGIEAVSTSFIPRQGLSDHDGLAVTLKLRR